MAKKILIDWRPEFTQTIRSRGMDYYRRDKVKNLKQDENFFSAEVSGSSGRRYMTFATLSDDFTRLERLSCTCPYAEDGSHCKHEAALMYLIENNMAQMITKETAGSALNYEDVIESLDEQDLIGGDGFFIDKDGFAGYESKTVETGNLFKDISSYRYFKYSQILRNARISEDIWKKGIILAKTSRISISKVELSEYFDDGFRNDRFTDSRSSSTGFVNDWNIGDEFSGDFSDQGWSSDDWNDTGDYSNSNYVSFEKNEFDKDYTPQNGDKLCNITARLKDSYFQTSVTVGPSYFFNGSCYVIGCDRAITKNIYGKRKIESPICEHQAAILYLLKDYLEKEYSVIDATDRSGEDLMKQLSGEYRVASIPANKRQKISESEKIDIEPVLSTYFDNNLSVSFRVGGSKKYKVQKLNELYMAVTHNRPLKIARKQINVSRDNLTPHGLRMFEFIESFAKESSFYTTGIGDYGFRQEDLSGYKDEIILFGHFLDDFYDLCKGTAIASQGLYHTTGSDAKLITFSQESISPSIHIENMKDTHGRGIGIHVSGKMPTMFQGRKYAYFIKEDKLNRIDSEDVQILRPFTSISEGGKFEFRIGLRNLTRFYYDTLPWLREHAVVTFDDADFLEQYILPRASFSFFLDREDSLVTCKALVSYDSLERNLVFDPDNEEGFRDSISENDVIGILKEYFPGVDLSKGLFVCEENKNEDRVYELLSHGLDELQAFGDVRHTDSFMSISIRKSPSFKVGVSLESSLLDLEITAQDMDPDELIELLNSYRKKKKYYRLKSGDYVSADSEEVENLAMMLDNMHIDLKSFVDGKMQLPAYRALYLNKMLEEQSWIYEHRDRHFKKLIQEFKTISDTQFDLPAGITGRLRKYQRDGYRWLRTLSKYGFGGILADEMGLGKTLQTITLLLSYYERFENGADIDSEDEAAGISENGSKVRKPSLVVVPASLVYNWSEELHRFAPALNYVLITGTKKERDDLILNIEGFDVAVTSYDLLKRDIKEYESHFFAMEIIDEAQFIKNHLSQASKSVKLINADRRFALTGTPIENRLSELWSIFDYLMPGLLYGYEQFRSEFELPIMRYEEETPMERLRAMVTPFILRRKKDDVLKDLPDKLEEIRYARMDEDQKKLYDAQVVRMKKRLEKQSDDEFKKNKLEILAELTRLRQICCDPSLCFEDYNKGSCKTDVFMDMIDQVVQGEHKALVFSQFVTMIEILKKRLDAEQIPYYEITGATPKEKRIELVNAFNSDSTPVFLISLKAGGTGLNLTGADVVIHYDPWWNLAVQNQATDRAHRIGQRRVVTVFKLIAHGTIEDKIVEMQEKKRALAESILESDGISSASLSRDDLLQLLS